MPDDAYRERREVTLPRPSREMVARAREFRKALTPAEKLLWERVRGGRLHGSKFRRQHPLGTSIADFFCDDALLVIEVDGAVHREPTQEDRDRNRDATMREFGLGVLRFTNHEVLRETERVLETISGYVLGHSVSRGGAVRRPSGGER